VAITPRIMKPTPSRTSSRGSSAPTGVMGLVGRAARCLPFMASFWRFRRGSAKSDRMRRLHSFNACGFASARSSRPVGRPERGQTGRTAHSISAERQAASGVDERFDKKGSTAPSERQSGPLTGEFEHTTSSSAS
jgi:hypothetical protein